MKRNVPVKEILSDLIPIRHFIYKTGDMSLPLRTADLTSLQRHVASPPKLGLLLRIGIRQGLSDEELMRKYRLSGDSLKRLLADLLRAVASGSPHVEVEPEE